ncbi:8-oxo-dGTP pyrophosphatase MutT (NUDIX family) [Flavobacterium sp. CG_9.1]|uniref:NUDIX hydrolase n=1 Tax=Flavobacterium sp. CG_9.1 TaxID=2787728 RepID=UPI0018C9376A|nr:NUDIX domain-containing protein [Flavobacterium sp. CG_9.1]MBG6063651.1 8-oxo-dGTP pyrophosphatase MutT (NUDIX family) [Flavobacterium sp. CG_9.1]
MLKQFTTSVFIINKYENDLKILLINHKKFNRWMVPGGHIESFENQIEGVIREAKEETGLNIKLFSFLHKEKKVEDSEWLLPPEFFYQQLIPASNKENAHYHLDFAYLSFVHETEFVFNTKETKDIMWINLNESINLNLFEGTKIIINELITKFNNNEKILYEQKE